MNKIFKIIFNTSLGRMVIVSENAKSQGKVKSTQDKQNQAQVITSMIKTFKPLLLVSSLFISPDIFAGNIVQSQSCSGNSMPGILLTYGAGNSAQFTASGHLNSAIATFGDNAVSIGSDCSNLTWALSNAVAIGGAAASVSGVAIGTGALAYNEYNVAMGSQAKARGKNSVALGANSVADRDNTFAVGSTTNLRQITSVAAGTENTDAVNKLQMDDSVGVVNSRVTTEVGSLNTRVTSEVGTLDSKIRLNKDAITTLDTRVGNEVSTLDGKIGTNTGAITALDGRVTTNEGDIASLKSGQGTLNQLAVQYDTTIQDSITLKGTNGTKLTNLQDATLAASSTDAVTGGQLFTTNQNVTNLDNRVTTEVGTLNTRITSEVGTLDGQITTNSNAISGLDGRVTTNEGDIASLKSGQGTLNQLAVQYDTTIQDSITLKGTNGTKLTNLQDATLAASSTDAVTGGQLFTTNQSLTLLSTQANAGAQQIKDILGGGASYSNGIFTLPTFSIQGKSYSNIGDTFGAVDNEINLLKTSVSDLKTYVDQQNNGNTSNIKSYIDQQDSKNLTDAKNYTDQQASATLDSANQYTDLRTEAVFNDAKDYVDQEISGLNNTAGTGKNSTAIGPNTVVTGDNSTAIGVGNNVSGNNSGAFGDPNIVTANGSYVVGNDNIVNGDNTFVLGNNVNTSAKDSVVLGNNSASTRDNTVSVGASGNERQITNVANATESTDAVNLRQMQATNTETLKSSKDYTDTRVSALERSFSDFSYQTDRRFQEVDKRFDRQGAMSAAMMNMATSTAGLKGLNRVGLAAGFQGDEKAIAIGYQRIVSENLSLSLGGAFTDEDGSGGAGIGFSW